MQNENVVLGDDEEAIKITSKGARYFGLFFIKNAIKELDLCKKKFLSIRNLVSKLDDKEADKILLFLAKEGISPIVAPIHEVLVTLNEDFLEVLREGLIQKKVKTLADAMELYDYEDCEECLENEMHCE